MSVPTVHIFHKTILIPEFAAMATQVFEHKRARETPVSSAPRL